MWSSPFTGQWLQTFGNDQKDKVTPLESRATAPPHLEEPAKVA